MIGKEGMAEKEIIGRIVPGHRRQQRLPKPRKGHDFNVVGGVWNSSLLTRVINVVLNRNACSKLGELFRGLILISNN